MSWFKYIGDPALIHTAMSTVGKLVLDNMTTFSETNEVMYQNMADSCKQFINF